MTKSTLFDRLNQELEAFGKKAQAALDEGKLQIELLRVRRRLDRAARDLGLLVHRRERGGERGIDTTHGADALQAPSTHPRHGRGGGPLGEKRHSSVRR